MFGISIPLTVIRIISLRTNTNICNRKTLEIPDVDGMRSSKQCGENLQLTKVITRCWHISNHRLDNDSILF